MATITPTVTPRPDVKTISYVWNDMATGDTIDAMKSPGVGAGALLACAQIAGTFGGATVTLTGSNDGVNFHTLKDVGGSDITMTAAGMAEFSTAALYLKPAISGGAGDSVTVTVAMRG